MNDTQKLLDDYARLGSEPAFAELVQKYINLVYSTALRLTIGDTHLAEDITQMVFADLARSAPSLSKKITLGGWLHRHACFLAAKTMRSERRRRVRETEAVEMNVPEDHANYAELAPELDEAINELNDEDRLAILLRFFEQCDFSSVGLRLGVSEEAARKRVSRALDKLQSGLAHRGLTRSAAFLGVALGTGIILSAPTNMAAEIARSALTASAGAKAVAGFKFLAAGKIKMTAIAIGFAAAVATPLYIEHQTQAAVRAENRVLHAKVEQLTELQAQNVTAISQAPAVNSSTPPASPPVSQSPDTFRELIRLRGEVGVLRDQLAKATAAKKPANPVPSEKTKEPADITISFPGIPLTQLVPAYQYWSGKVLTIAPEVSPHIMIWLKTIPGMPLTKSQAIPWIEEAVKDQGHVSIVTNDDGSLRMIPAPPGDHNAK
jgi:RNA polymerase sigma factor (sigma-70 family)